MVNIGEIIKQRVRELKLSNVYVAKQLGCHRTNLYKIYGRSSIDTGILYHLCIILDYDFFELYSKELKRERKKSSK
jgi:hypothetical protein